MHNGTFNQGVEFSGKIGGVRRVFEGQVKLLVGGFKYNLADLPSAGNVLPAGTPVQVDEQARTIKPLIAFEVVGIDSADAKKIKVATYNEGARGKVGMTLGICPASLSSAVASGKYATVSAFAMNEGYADVELSDALTGLAVGDVIVELGASDKKVKAVPNALTPYDICLDADATSCDGDAAWASYDFPVLERRMPVLNPVIKKALADAGCFFRFSNRK